MTFKSLKSAYVELDYSGNSIGRQSIVKWKVDSKSDSFTLLMAKSLDSARDNNDDDRVADLAHNTDFTALAFCVECCLTDALIRSSFLEMLVTLLSEELQNVVVMDAKKQGTLVLGEDELVQFRNPRTLDNREVSIKVWSAPVLQLPFSGCVMNTVKLFVFKGSDEFDDYSAVEEAFQGHEIYGEATIELRKKRAIYHGKLETK